jgi:hypothetical protein
MRTFFFSVSMVYLALFTGCPAKQACSASQPCSGDQVCAADGTCQAPTVTTLQVSDPLARGCEVLLTEAAGTTFASATFTQGTVGTALRQAPRVALTFVAPKDAAIAAGSVQLALAGGSASGLAVTSASCVDAAGNRLPGATISVK